MGGLTHCYPSPASMTVCSGFNGTCYVSATVVDIGVIFLSYDNIVHTVHLTVRVNPEAIIDLLLGRATLRLYKFNKLTPRALGFSLQPELSPLRADIDKASAPRETVKYDRKTATPKQVWPSVPTSVPTVAEPKKTALHAVKERMNSFS